MSMPDDQPGDTLLGAQMHRTGGSLSTPPPVWNQPSGPPPPPKRETRKTAEELVNR
jgi:hypothetical protein